MQSIGCSKLRVFWLAILELLCIKGGVPTSLRSLFFVSTVSMGSLIISYLRVLWPVVCLCFIYHLSPDSARLIAQQIRNHDSNDW